MLVFFKKSLLPWWGGRVAATGQLQRGPDNALSDEGESPGKPQASL
jgi:hypothetical protein